MHGPAIATVENSWTCHTWAQLVAAPMQINLMHVLKQHRSNVSTFCTKNRLRIAQKTSVGIHERWLGELLLFIRKSIFFCDILLEKWAILFWWIFQFVYVYFLCNNSLHCRLLVPVFSAQSLTLHYSWKQRFCFTYLILHAHSDRAPESCLVAKWPMPRKVACGEINHWKMFKAGQFLSENSESPLHASLFLSSLSLSKETNLLYSISRSSASPSFWNTELLEFHHLNTVLDSFLKCAHSIMYILSSASRRFSSICWIAHCFGLLSLRWDVRDSTDVLSIFSWRVFAMC